ncbi:TIGR03087 family PEP-CTERM/XrtA system glycosyltransferase [Qipengyuania nanhaisediminis]|uniref:Sugar transferase, PEP-CTERM/EpsH1 system associated n=1 Tax=Qipengyuania nanhaisediminis TaxID=604088 RepID=A0A1I5MQN7_9SPHN|nr:TIGR03087 family PEP-CTERM/XrtA system glycosyltransferase [Qipengyuania nanhaisediminis]SFP11617.1 sugar transferase, PEP-CTERM/EpsH1 system associated [Qipengyuania nanhaisediminis]
MGEILFLAHRMPFPPNRGDKIRSHHLLKALARLAPVHVGTFAETQEDRDHHGELSAIAASIHMADRTKPLVLAGIQAVLSGKPVSLAAFHDRGLQSWVEQTLAAQPIDTVVIFSGQMGQYLPDSFDGRVIIDLCDVDSAKFEAYAEAGNMAWINAREGRLLAAEEERLARRADVTALISESEAALLRSRISPRAEADIRVFGNGVDTQFFDPATGLDQAPYDHRGPNLVFTGQMDYAPNVAAVERFTHRVLPELAARYDAQFHIVGRAPTDSVHELGKLPGVTVWGGVPDMRPFLGAATAVVAPLSIARGVQNKVLEAMAMARLVVLSEEAATGIPAQDGQHFLIARDDAAMVSKLRDLLEGRRDGRAIGAEARQFVANEMSWEAIYEQVATLVQPDGKNSRAA